MVLQLQDAYINHLKVEILALNYNNNLKNNNNKIKINNHNNKQINQIVQKHKIKHRKL